MRQAASCLRQHVLVLLEARQLLDPAHPRLDVGIGPEVDGALLGVGDVAIDRDVGHGRLVADQEGRLGQRGLEHLQRVVRQAGVELVDVVVGLHEAALDGARAVDVGRQPVELPEQPLAHPRLLLGRLAAHLAELVGEIEQDRARLAEFQVAVDQRRHLAEAVDGEIVRLLVGAGAQIDMLVGKGLAHQRHRQPRLVGRTAQPDAVKCQLGHVLSLRD